MTVPSRAKTPKRRYACRQASSGRSPNSAKYCPRESPANDHTDRNDDSWLIPAGESATIADLTGPGACGCFASVSADRAVPARGLGDLPIGGTLPDGTVTHTIQPHRSKARGLRRERPLSRRTDQAQTRSAGSGRGAPAQCSPKQSEGRPETWQQERMREGGRESVPQCVSRQVVQRVS